MSRRWLLVALLSLTALHLAILAYHLTVTAAFPYDLNYGEGYVLNDAVRLSRGENLYVDIQQFPMVRSPYPPLFPWLWSRIVPLAGPGLFVGRALSIASLTALVALVGWSAWRVRCGLWPVIAAVGLVVASPFVYQWSGYARVDLLALALAVGGVVAAQWLDGKRGLFVAALLCGLAIWTKQTAITATLAVGLAFGLRAWRGGALFVALVGLPSSVAVVVLNSATSGEFARHVLAGNAANPIIPLRAAIYLGVFGALFLPALIGCAWWLRQALSRSSSPVALYLPIGLLAAFSAGNGGSSVNYLLEPVFALALAVPFAWRAVRGRSLTVGPLLAVAQLAMLLHWPNAFGTAYLAESALGRTPTAADAVAGAHMDAIVRAEPGEVIAEPAGFEVRNGLPVYVQPIDLRAEQLLGRWRSGLLVQALSSGRFGMVVTAYNFLPVDAEVALEQHFVLSETLDSPDGLTFRVYRFRD